jgi:hypothetical protein
MTVLLIDDRGKVWESHSLMLRSRLRASIDDGELHEFAILNLGFIGLAILKGSVRIQLRPVLTKPAALSALYLWLHQCAPERLVVTWYNGRWHDEIIGWHRDGWRRITCLLESPEHPTQGFSRGAIRPNRLPSRNPLRHVLEDTARLASIFVNPAQMLPEPLCYRYVLFMEDENRELRVCDFGCTMMARSPQWQSRARGRRIDDLPDWNYGQWVADAYREAGRSGQPLLEEVAAVIDWPELGTLSHAYWRLIVPLIEPGMRARILGMTLDNGSGSVRKVG